MPLSLGWKWGSGKSSFMGSLSEWLTTQIPGETFEFDNPILPASMPAYGVVEVGLFNIGAQAMGDFVGNYYDEWTSGYSGVSGASGWEVTSGYSGVREKFARRNQTLVEITAWDDVTRHSDASGKVRQMRDKVIWSLYNAGRDDGAGGFVAPIIKMYDYYQTPKKQTGVIILDPSDNAINEKFVVDPVNQNIKMYRMLIRFFYFEYIN